MRLVLLAVACMAAQAAAAAGASAPDAAAVAIAQRASVVDRAIKDVAIAQRTLNELSISKDDETMHDALHSLSVLHGALLSTEHAHFVLGQPLPPPKTARRPADVSAQTAKRLRPYLDVPAPTSVDMVISMARLSFKQQDEFVRVAGRAADALAKAKQAVAAAAEHNANARGLVSSNADVEHARAQLQHAQAALERAEHTLYEATSAVARHARKVHAEGAAPLLRECRTRSLSRPAPGPVLTSAHCRRQERVPLRGNDARRPGSGDERH